MGHRSETCRVHGAVGGGLTAIDMALTTQEAGRPDFIVTLIGTKKVEAVAYLATPAPGRCSAEGNGFRDDAAVTIDGAIPDRGISRLRGTVGQTTRTGGQSPTALSRTFL